MDIDHRGRRLVVAVTGFTHTTLAAEAAHSLSRVKPGTYKQRTAADVREVFYDDPSHLQFAGLTALPDQKVLRYEPSTIDQRAGGGIAGVLGLNPLPRVEIAE